MVTGRGACTTGGLNYEIVNVNSLSNRVYCYTHYCKNARKECEQLACQRAVFPFAMTLAKYFVW